MKRQTGEYERSTVGKVYAKSDGTGPYYDVKFEGLDEMVSVPSVYLERVG
tara:strand:+ start:266 stop:415 length:150 start_codon:yes stop_codon:yes gene_type:complete